MIRSLWIAKTGLDAQQTQIDVISQNLANVSTNGFKRSRAVFEDLLYQTVRQPGAQSSQQTQLPSGLQLGTGVRPVATSRTMSQGNLQQTGNSLDLAINGNGFFQVQMPDGTTAPCVTECSWPARACRPWPCSPRNSACRASSSPRPWACPASRASSSSIPAPAPAAPTSNAWRAKWHPD